MNCFKPCRKSRSRSKRKMGEAFDNICWQLMGLTVPFSNTVDSQIAHKISDFQYLLSTENGKSIPEWWIRSYEFWSRMKVWRRYKISRLFFILVRPFLSVSHHIDWKTKSSGGIVCSTLRTLGWLSVLVIVHKLVCYLVSKRSTRLWEPSQWSHRSGWILIISLVWVARTLPDGYIRTSPLPRVPTMNPHRVPLTAYLGLLALQPIAIC